jgi:cell division protein FtsQ
MDGRGRLAEPVTDGAQARLLAGATPPYRRVRDRARLSIGRGRLERQLRRWLGPLWNWRLPRGAGIVAAIAFVLASAFFGIVRGDHWPMFAVELRDLRDAVANTLGFRITSIALSGPHQLTREQILTTAGVTDRTSLLFLDASAARARLKANPWIADATVLKLYPGRLHIAVIERKPFALWQKNGRVRVISDDGTVIEPHVTERFASLPLVVGIGAETRAKGFLALLDKYPLVRNQLRAAVLVAERRWNVMLNNGIDVRLPENDVAQALDTLVQLDRDKNLLTRDITAVDLRLPDRVTVRLSDEAWAARQETPEGKRPNKAGGAA